MQRVARHISSSLCMALLALGCASASDSEPAATRPASVTEPGPSTPAPLPAWPLPGDRTDHSADHSADPLPGKADAADDVRATAPWQYAITEAPVAQAPELRPMVEWEPVQALWMNLVDWHADSANVRSMLLAIVEAAAPKAEIWLTVGDASVREALEAELQEATGDGTLRFIPAPSESIWAVDFGPFPVHTPGGQAWVDFSYYQGRPHDDGLPTVLGQALGATVYRAELPFEGGNLQADAQGRCFTTQRGLNRSGLSEALFGERLQRYVGCTTVHILADIPSDPTGHVDMFARWVAPGTVVLGQFADADTADAKALEDNVALLAALDPELTIHRIPMAGYAEADQGPFDPGQAIPLTHVNATQVNGINLWPVYATPEWSTAQDAAAAAWATALPDYDHVAIAADDIAAAAGAIHCVTRAIPVGALSPVVASGTCTDDVCVPATDAGYLGACAANPSCLGPRWLCQCNRCDECPGAPLPEACAGVPFEGCCRDHTLLWCSEGMIRTETCPPGHCGWADDPGWYSCQAEPSASPYSHLPLDCPCVPQCGDRQCGDDGCGGSCGTCPASTVCHADGRCAPEGELCDDACDAAAPARCTELGVLTCEPDTASDCLVEVIRPCRLAESCRQGVCVAADLPDPLVAQAADSRCSAATSPGDRQPRDSAPQGVIVIAALALLAWSRTRAQRAR